MTKANAARKARRRGDDTERELVHLREENERLRAGLLAMQTPVRKGADSIRVHRDALIEAFCALVPEGEDYRGWVRECLLRGMVPSITNERARVAEREAQLELTQIHGFLSRLDWHLRLPRGIKRPPHTFEGALDTVRLVMEHAQVEGATWMREAASAELDPAAVCAARRPKEPT